VIERMAAVIENLVVAIVASLRCWPVISAALLVSGSSACVRQPSREQLAEQLADPDGPRRRRRPSPWSQTFLAGAESVPASRRQWPTATSTRRAPSNLAHGLPTPSMIDDYKTPGLSRASRRPRSLPGMIDESSDRYMDGLQEGTAFRYRTVRSVGLLLPGRRVQRPCSVTMRDARFYR